MRRSRRNSLRELSEFSLSRRSSCATSVNGGPDEDIITLCFPQLVERPFEFQGQPTPGITPAQHPLSVSEQSVDLSFTHQRSFRNIVKKHRSVAALLSVSRRNTVAPHRRGGDLGDGEIELSGIAMSKSINDYDGGGGGGLGGNVSPSPMKSLQHNRSTHSRLRNNNSIHNRSHSASETLIEPAPLKKNEQKIAEKVWTQQLQSMASSSTGGAASANLLASASIYISTSHQLEEMMRNMGIAALPHIAPHLDALFKASTSSTTGETRMYFPQFIDLLKQCKRFSVLQKRRELEQERTNFGDDDDAEFENVLFQGALEEIKEKNTVGSIATVPEDDFDFDDERSGHPPPSHSGPTIVTAKNLVDFVAGFNCSPASVVPPDLLESAKSAKVDQMTEGGGIGRRQSLTAAVLKQRALHGKGGGGGGAPSVISASASQANFGTSRRVSPRETADGSDDDEYLPPPKEELSPARGNDPFSVDDVSSFFQKRNDTTTGEQTHDGYDQADEWWDDDDDGRVGRRRRAFTSLNTTSGGGGGVAGSQTKKQNEIQQQQQQQRKRGGGGGGATANNTSSHSRVLPHLNTEFSTPMQRKSAFSTTKEVPPVLRRRPPRVAPSSSATASSEAHMKDASMVYDTLTMDTVKAVLAQMKGKKRVTML